MILMMMKNDDEPILSLICLVFVDTCHSVERIWSIFFAGLITIPETGNFKQWNTKDRNSIERPDLGKM